MGCHVGCRPSLLQGQDGPSSQLLTEASGYPPRGSGATMGLLAKCTSIVHLGSGQVELPHCPCLLLGPGLAWCGVSHADASCPPTRTSVQARREWSLPLTSLAGSPW